MIGELVGELDRITVVGVLEEDEFVVGELEAINVIGVFDEADNVLVGGEVVGTMFVRVTICCVSEQSQPYI